MTAKTQIKPIPADETLTEPAPAPLSPTEVRETAGLSQAEMADLLGMSAFGYAQWEDGTRRPGGPAYRLLHLIARDGKTVIDALRTIKV